jgi:hypothetical protein
MLGRAAIPDTVLAEVGWVTINFSGLEELLIRFAAALLNADDQEPAMEVITRMGFREKIDTLRRLFIRRCAETRLDYVQQMNDTLSACQSAGAHRNDLVHGLAEYTDGAAWLARPGKKPLPITLDEINRINREIFDAQNALLSVVTPFWNATKGHFSSSAGTR